MSNQAPIDIKYGEILIWLQERYLIPKDWAKRLEVILTMKNEIIEEVYRRESAEFKKIQDMFKNVKYDMKYLDIVKLNQMLLKTEEANSKTLFGSYNSPLIKKSYLLSNLYEKNLIHLCESSKFIIQNIGYEIPNFEKNISYNERIINEYNGRINEKNSVIERNKEKLKNLFRYYKINESEDIKLISKDILLKLYNFQNLLIEIEKLLRHDNIRKIIDYYKKFYKTFNNQDIDSIDNDFLINLKTINEKGDVGNQNYDFIKQTVLNLLDSLNGSENIETAVWNIKLSGEIKFNTILTSSIKRKKILNDLNEILIFINTRIFQMQKEDEFNLTIYQINLRQINEELNIEFQNESKKFISCLMDKLNNNEFNFLANIYEDEKNLISIIKKFESIYKENNELYKDIKDFKCKIEETYKEVKDNKMRIEQFKKDSKIVKKQMEKFLTDNLKRKITIIGDINLI